MHESSPISTQVFRTLAASNVMSISIVKQCQFLDQVLGTEFTMEFLDNTQLSLKNLKNRILKADHLKTLKAAEGQRYAVAVANNNAWLKLWDTALDYGSDGTRTSLAILKLMCSTVFTDRKCHVDSCSYNLPANTPLCDHLLTHHISLQPDSSNYTSPMDLVELIISTASDSDNFSAVLSVGLAISKSLHYF